MGNVRLSYKRGSTGLAQITDQNDYYPFGMNIPREEKAVFGTNSLYNYKYNGKELQETGMYDYGARFYMPDIGRWGVVDPLAETSRRFSPYNYAFNNPIRFIDPDGRQGKDWYQNNLTQNIEWHDGSAELDGYTNLTAINNTRVIESVNGLTVSTTDLLPDGSFVSDGQIYNNGESVNTVVGTTITSKPGFNLENWLAHLGNTGGDFFANLGGAAPIEPYSNPFFRGDIDKIVSVDGYFGGIHNGLSRGDKGDPNLKSTLMNTMVDVMSLVDLAYSQLTGKGGNNDTVALVGQIYDSPLSYPRDTIKLSTPQNKSNDSVQFRRSVDSVNGVKRNNFYNRINFLGKNNWK